MTLLLLSSPLPSPKKRNKNSCVGTKTVWNVHMSRLGLHGAPPGWLTGCSVTGEQDSTTRKASLIIRTEANKEVHQPAHRLWEQRKKGGGGCRLGISALQPLLRGEAIAGLLPTGQELGAPVGQDKQGWGCAPQSVGFGPEDTKVGCACAQEHMLQRN